MLLIRANCSIKWNIHATRADCDECVQMEKKKVRIYTQRVEHSMNKIARLLYYKTVNRKINSVTLL